MDQFYSAEHVVAVGSPADPILCHRPHAAQRAARWFAAQFRGTVFYAVKANPDPIVLEALASGGVDRFDVASLAEIRAVRRQFPSSTLAFMNPVKAPEAIAEAYFRHGVRIFALDRQEELDKIVTATKGAGDLTLIVRIGVDNSTADLKLGMKFGARGPAVADLIRTTRWHAEKLGVSFHIGSQNRAPEAFVQAMTSVAGQVQAAGVLLDILDVGGGFPAAYPGRDHAALSDYIEAIHRAFDRFPAFGRTALWAEPGRALVAEAASLIVRVEGRRDFDLYINDGIYGALYDAGHLNWRFPCRAVGHPADAMTAPFRFYGPTCDDADYMEGPFFLPAGMAQGDTIEIGQLGAYGRTMTSGFNGYGSYKDVICTDDPFGSLYEAADLRALAETKK